MRALFLCLSMVGLSALAASSEGAHDAHEGYLGVTLSDDPRGIRVESLAASGPGATGGLRQDDVIVSAQGRHFGSTSSFARAVREAGAGTRFLLKVVRGSNTLALTVTLGERPSMELAVGQPAPPLAAEVVHGPGPADLVRLRGRVVLLDFWASWCGPCRAAMPFLDGLSASYGPQGLTVLGVTDETASIVRQVLAETPVSYTLAREPTAAARFGIAALPTLVVIDRAGKVRDVGVGLDEAGLVQLVTTLLAEPAPR